VIAKDYKRVVLSGVTMRSEQVFRATEQIGNRYVLCRLTAKTTRRLHFASLNTQDAIQDAFVRVCLAMVSPYHNAYAYTELGEQELAPRKRESRTALALALD